MIFKFNTAKAISYAYTHINKNNPFYKSFQDNREGVNFISQCVMAGCEGLNSKSCPEWYYENEKNYSKSWVQKDEFLRYLLNQSSCGAVGRLINVNLLNAGDLIFFESKKDESGVGLVTKNCDQNIFFVVKNVKVEEKKFDCDDYDKVNCVHVLGVKK